MKKTTKTSSSSPASSWPAGGTGDGARRGPDVAAGQPRRRQAGSGCQFASKNLDLVTNTAATIRQTTRSSTEIAAAQLTLLFWNAKS